MELLKEIDHQLSIGVLSQNQVAIFYDYLKGLTYDKIRKYHKLSCNNVIVRIVIRTIQLLHWEYGHIGGSEPYLNIRDLERFERLIDEYAGDINCITSSTALQLAKDLHDSRYKKSVRFLVAIGKINLINHIKQRESPSREYIYEILKKRNFKIVNSQTLEFGRRFFCDFDTIALYFTIYGFLFDRDKRLILNMDETSLSSKKRLKVIAREAQLPLMTEQPKIPHMTACVTITANGEYFKPMIVLPNMKTLSKLKEFEDQCFFFSTSSGWMTKNAFDYYTLLMISNISMYRFNLNEKLRDEPILLILDGHPSHINFYAAYLFFIFNIDLLLIPPHTSHILSAFDVSIASAIKTFFAQELTKFKYKEIYFDKTKQFLTELRTHSIKSFLNAHVKACTPANIQAGFRHAGMVPFNPQVPLFSDYSMDSNYAYLFENKSKDEIPTFYLNSKSGLEFLFKKEFHRDLTENDLKNTYNNVVDLLTKNLNIDTGIPLSKLPDILIEKDKVFERFSVNIPK